MSNMSRKLFTTAALALMLCLSMLVISGTAFADERCMDNFNGTATDNGTGLIWQKNTAGPMNWDAAMSYCSNLSLGGHSDWGLPNRGELYGLYNSPCKNEMDVRTDWYWSSTAVANYTGSAWLVSFYWQHPAIFLR